MDKSILAIYHTDDRTFIKEEFAPQDYGLATKKGSGMSKYCEEAVQGWMKDGTIKKVNARREAAILQIRGQREGLPFSFNRRQ